MNWIFRSACCRSRCHPAVFMAIQMPLFLEEKFRLPEQPEISRRLYLDRPVLERVTSKTLMEPAAFCL